MAADFLDDASELAMEFNKASEEAIRALVPKEREVAEDEVVECLSCGVVLDSRRARLGFSNCVECSRWEEQHAKGYRRSSRLDD